jgi:exopolysaccharide biosynthesis polyprenyl glycosylphosphotransferase
VAQNNGAEAVMMVGGQAEPPDELRRTVWRLESAGVQVAWVPLPSSVAVPTVHEIGGTGVPVLTFEERSLAPETSRRKLIVDWVVALLATVLLSPALLAIALAIKVESPGPVLFRQARIGRAGRRFTMYKFRTMRDGAEEELDSLAHLNVHEGGTLFKIPDDPRITRVGRFLRKFSLDEVPQLFNVLRGEMSLVGPRPPLPGEVENYPDDLHRRFLVRPGLTGLWQVSGRSDLDPVESARIDAYYVEHWSPMMDAKIVFKTIKVVLFSDGAY